MPQVGTRGGLVYKPGVSFAIIAPAGFRILGALDTAARLLRCELTITSACDGQHSGENDPHHRGEAFDVRTHDLPEALKDAVLRATMAGLNDDGVGVSQPVPDIPRSLATSTFFAFVESPGTPNEHMHVQLRRGRNYP